MSLNEVNTRMLLISGPSIDLYIMELLQYVLIQCYKTRLSTTRNSVN